MMHSCRHRRTKTAQLITRSSNHDIAVSFNSRPDINVLFAGISTVNADQPTTEEESRFDLALHGSRVSDFFDKSYAAQSLTAQKFTH